jgi:hypothetical protein
MDRLGIPSIGIWRQWIPQAREAAEQLLREKTDLDTLCQQAIERAKEADEARFAQLRARMRYADPVSSEATATLLEKEERVSRALYAGVQAPRITLGTILAVFVSPHPLVRAGATHG